MPAHTQTCDTLSVVWVKVLKFLWRPSCWLKKKKKNSNLKTKGFSNAQSSYSLYTDNPVNNLNFKARKYNYGVQLLKPLYMKKNWVQVENPSFSFYKGYAVVFYTFTKALYRVVNLFS